MNLAIIISRTKTKLTLLCRFCICEAMISMCHRCLDRSFFSMGRSGILAISNQLILKKMMLNGSMRICLPVRDLAIKFWSFFGRLEEILPLYLCKARKFSSARIILGREACYWGWDKITLYWLLLPFILLSVFSNKKTSSKEAKSNKHSNPGSKNTKLNGIQAKTNIIFKFHPILWSAFRWWKRELLDGSVIKYKLWIFPQSPKNLHPN